MYRFIGVSDEELECRRSEHRVRKRNPSIEKYGRPEHDRPQELPLVPGVGSGDLDAHGTGWDGKVDLEIQGMSLYGGIDLEARGQIVSPGAGS